MNAYQQELKRSMHWLAAQPDTLFLGQSVGFPGTSMFASLAEIDPARCLEWPVAEELQMGAAIGLSLAGNCVPIAVFPRWNFLLLAANQLVNHLDRIPLYSAYRPKVIIRTAVGRSSPLDPGPQHQDDFTEPFRLMLKTVKVVRLHHAWDILPAYREAYQRPEPTLLVENG